MKKFLSIFSAFLVSAIVAVSGMTAFATDTSNVKIDCKDAVKTNTWGKSLSIPIDKFNINRITEDTQFVVTYEISDKTNFDDVTSSPVGLALQSMSDPDNALADEKGGVWAEVSPKTYDETSAIFYYSDLVKAYTSKDFSKIDYIHVIAPSAVTIKCTALTITDCLDKAPETTTTTTAAEAEVDSATQNEETTTAATTAAEVNSTATSEKSSGSNVVGIIIGIVAGVAIAVVIIVIIMNRKSSEAFDVSTGKFVDKKNLFDAGDTDKKNDDNSDTK